MALSDDPDDQKPLNTQQVCSSDNPADYILNQVTSEQCDAPALGGSTQTTGDLSLELKNDNTTKETKQTPDGATIQTSDGSSKDVPHKSITTTSAIPRPPKASPPSRMVSVVPGWIMQGVSFITPLISHILHNPFPAMYSSPINNKTGVDGSSSGQGWSSNTLVNHQPNYSIALFPAYQPTPMDGPLANDRDIPTQNSLSVTSLEPVIKPCSLEVETYAHPSETTQPPPASGWLQQTVSMMTPAITQKLCNMFPSMHLFSTTADNTTNQGPVRPPVQYSSLPPATVITRQPRCNMACCSAALLTQPSLQR